MGTVNHHQKEYLNKDIDPELDSLIELGVHGFYPLFEHINKKIKHFAPSKNLTRNEYEQAEKIFSRLRKHKSIERKKSIVCDLSPIDQEIFMALFIQKVEEKMTQKEKGLQ